MEIKTGKLPNQSFTAEDGSVWVGDLHVVAIQYSTNGVWDIYAQMPGVDDVSKALLRKGARVADLPPGFKGDLTQLLQDENTTVSQELKKLKKKAKKWKRRAQAAERERYRAEQQLLDLALDGRVIHGQREDDRTVDDSRGDDRPPKRQRRSRTPAPRDPETTP